LVLFDLAMAFLTCLAVDRLVIEPRRVLRASIAACGAIGLALVVASTLRSFDQTPVVRRGVVLAVALALRDTLANLFAGIQLLASRQVTPGDFVRFEGGEGYVADITWRNTSITDAAGGRVIVPNEKLAGSIVTNATRADGLHLLYTFAFPPALDAAAMLRGARERLAHLGVADVRVFAQSEAAVTCAALVVTTAADAFAVRAAVAEAVATLARIEPAAK
ncbi:MAG: mechanosensitive ion channel family protein, partial [Candidatus Velthaea sp.]